METEAVCSPGYRKTLRVLEEEMPSAPIVALEQYISTSRLTKWAQDLICALSPRVSIWHGCGGKLFYSGVAADIRSKNWSSLYKRKLF